MAQETKIEVKRLDKGARGLDRKSVSVTPAYNEGRKVVATRWTNDGSVSLLIVGKDKDISEALTLSKADWQRLVRLMAR